MIILLYVIIPTAIIKVVIITKTKWKYNGRLGEFAVELWTVWAKVSSRIFTKLDLCGKMPNS